MKRWTAPFLLTLLAALPILLLHPDPYHVPVFHPLAPRVLFELYPSPEPSAIACVVSILALFAFLRELTDRPGLTLGATGSLALAHWVSFDVLVAPLFTLGALTAAIGLARHRLKGIRYLPTALALCGFAVELRGQGLLGTRSVLLPYDLILLPGLLMAPLAFYARYERLRGRATVPSITPETPPATRTTREASGETTWPWIVLTLVSTATITLVAPRGDLLAPMLLVVGLVFASRGHRPSWPWHLAFGALFVFDAVRVVATGRNPLDDLDLSETKVYLAALLPSLAFGKTLIGTLTSTKPSPLPYVVEGTSPFGFAAGLAATLEARREWALALAGLAFAALAFLHPPTEALGRELLYSALAFRSLFVAALGAAVLRGVATAWCPPAKRGPPRRSPAPGSLPRP